MGPTATPTIETVGVGGGLSVAEVAAVATPPDASCYSALLYCLTDHHAVLFELLREDGVQEGVAAGVQREDEHGEYFGSFQRYKMETTGCAGCEESYWKPADEVSEY